MKHYVLYHGNCWDGLAAAFATRNYMPPDTSFLPVVYGQPIPEMEDNSFVVIVDFSYPRDVIRDLHARMARLIVIDHHKTAEADLSGLHDELKATQKKTTMIKFDMEKSAAVLTWEFFETQKVPLLYEYIQDRDLWKFELPFSKEVTACLRSYPMRFDTLRARLVNPIENMITEGRACLRLTNQMVEEMCKHAVKIALDHFEMYCANATCLFSEVGNRLLELYLPPVAAYYMDRGDRKRQWGLRSMPHFDCSNIAKAYGGGGHKNAAGFISDTNFLPLVK